MTDNQHKNCWVLVGASGSIISRCGVFAFEYKYEAQYFLNTQIGRQKAKERDIRIVKAKILVDRGVSK